MGGTMCSTLPYDMHITITASDGLFHILLWQISQHMQDNQPHIVNSDNLLFNLD